MSGTTCIQCKQKNTIITILTIGFLSCIILFSAYIYKTDKECTRAVESKDREEQDRSLDYVSIPDLKQALREILDSLPSNKE
jgi:hypothetical protein